MNQPSTATDPTATRPKRSVYAELPPLIRVEDMTTGQPARDPGDPTFDGRDPDNLWMVRHA